MWRLLRLTRRRRADSVVRADSSEIRDEVWNTTERMDPVQMVQRLVNTAVITGAKEATKELGMGPSHDGVDSKLLKKTMSSRVAQKIACLALDIRGGKPESDVFKEELLGLACASAAEPPKRLACNSQNACSIDRFRCKQRLVDRHGTCHSEVLVRWTGGGGSLLLDPHDRRRVEQSLHKDTRPFKHVERTQCQCAVVRRQKEMQSMGSLVRDSC